MIPAAVIRSAVLLLVRLAAADAVVRVYEHAAAKKRREAE